MTKKPTSAKKTTSTKKIASKKKSTPKDNPFKKLDKLLKQNKKVDFKTINLLSAKKLERLDWKGITKKDQLQALNQLKAYQRITRLLVEDQPKIIKELLKKNIHSAVQIASIPKQKFLQDFSKIFGGDVTLMKEFYARATAVRSRVLIKYMNIVQNSQRHTKAVKAIS